MTIFRLSQTKDRRGTTVVNIDGQLVGEYVPVAENCCSQALSGLSGPPINRTPPDAPTLRSKRSPLVKARCSVLAAGFVTVVTSLCFALCGAALGSREVEEAPEAAPEIRKSGALNTAVGSADQTGYLGCGAEGIVERARPSVCLIQGSYIFRDKESGNVLRRADWILDGDDTVLETSYSGTGFLISSDGQILTNRHIAQPWWKDADAQRIVSAGYRPELKRLTAYFPRRTAAYRLTPLLTSKRGDLAVVRAGDNRDLPAPLALGGETAAVPGTQVFIMGYPAGVGAIIGRTGRAKIERVPGFFNFTDQQLSQVLAMRSLIEPFMAAGHLSNVTSDVLTVSALTSEGSSGSPVLDRQGKVIAVLFASLPDVAGWGLAVPSRLARELVGTEQ